MDQKAIDRTNALIQAEKIKNTMDSEGWPLIRQILQDNIDSLESIHDIKSLKDLQARQSALKALKGFLLDLDGIKEAAAHSLDEQVRFFESARQILKVHK